MQADNAGTQSSEADAKNNRGKWGAEDSSLQVVLIHPVTKWLSETTAHGLDRLVGQRALYIKVLWFAGFCLGLAAFVTQVQTFIGNFLDRPETTTLKQNSVEFTFPDVYICNKAIMSGSYPFIMSASSIAAVNSYVTQLQSLLGVPPTQQHATSFAKALLATIPYQLLSDYLGHQTQQFLFVTSMNGQAVNLVNFTTFYSPAELNCIQLLLSDEQRSGLSTEGSYLEIGLFLDSAFFTFPKTNALLPIPIANQTEGLNFLSWDFSAGINVDSPNGVNLYFASPGHYPKSESMIQLSAGKDYLINLEISRLTLGKGMVCLSSPEPRILKSPYDGSEVTYPYSESLCRAERSNELLLQHKGCVSHLLPRSSRFSNASKCLNASRVLAGQVSQSDFVAALTSDAYSSLSLNQKEIQQYCYNLRPCQADSYIYGYSFGNWPRIFSSFQRQILAKFQAMVQLKAFQFPGNRFPGYADVLSVANSLLTNLTTDTIVTGSNYFQDQLMRVRVLTGKALGSGVQIDKSYDLANLVADTGGLIGLYLGCSLLTLLEVGELLHDFIAGCYSAIAVSLGSKERRETREAAENPASAVSIISRTSASSSVISNRDYPGYHTGGSLAHRERTMAALKVTDLDL